MSVSLRRAVRRTPPFASTVSLLPLLLAPGLAWADDAATEVSSMTVRGARGGGGGILNRVTGQADGTQGGELVLQGGSWSNRRVPAICANR